MGRLVPLCRLSGALEAGSSACHLDRRAVPRGPPRSPVLKSNDAPECSRAGQSNKREAQSHMKTARSANLEGAVVGRLVTIVRGERHFTLPTRELGDLLTLLRALGEGAPNEAAAAPPVAQETVVVPARRGRPPLNRVAVETVVSAVSPASAPAKRKPGRQKRPDTGASAGAPKSTQRRGRVWEGIQDLLAREGPQSREAIVDMVISNGLTDRDPDHATKIAIGKKLSAGELVDLGDGRIGLPGGRPAVRKAGSEDDDEVDESGGAEKKRHRPGALWHSMKTYLAGFPGGLTEAEIVRATAENGWTSASDPSHAVKICLTRVRDQLTRFGDRFALAGMTPPAPKPTHPTVRRRKRQTDSEPAAEETAASPEPSPATTESAKPEADPPWKAYPTRRRNRDY